MKYNIQDIMKYLPHRYPFLLIDRVESVSDDLTTAVVIKNITANIHGSSLRRVGLGPFD